MTDKLELELSNDFDALHKFTSHHELKQFVERFESNNDLQKAFVYGRPTEQLFAELKKCFRFLTAAGGLVSNQDGDLLVVHRLGVYDLPKGKTEKGENFEETALREVTEECNIEPLYIQHSICSTFHTYTQNGIHYLKETAWFMMDYKGNGPLIPQTEENITSAEWINPEKLDKVKDNTYPSIIQVLESAGY